MRLFLLRMKCRIAAAKLSFNFDKEMSFFRFLREETVL